METFARARQFRILVASVLLAVLLLAGFGCTIRLIAEYDEQTDRSVTALQRKMEAFFVHLGNIAGTPEADYANYKDFYEEVRVDISAIKLRVDAKPLNTQTQEQIDLLERSVNDLEEIHELGIRHAEVVETLRKQFNTAFVAILKLELEKKRGE
ncbi:MAG: hypothetical protein JSV16_09170 [Candidatus Hydrogenedentota bacterium]|nr:MAG: hypothetical protein JSV16_09170 [Candidatus Hydrogenedentota bacterium]